LTSFVKSDQKEKR